MSVKTLVMTFFAKHYHQWGKTTRNLSIPFLAFASESTIITIKCQWERKRSLRLIATRPAVGDEGVGAGCVCNTQIAGLPPTEGQIQRVWAGPENLHSQQVPRGCCYFWLGNHTLRTTELKDPCGFPPFKGKKNRAWLFLSVSFDKALGLRHRALARLDDLPKAWVLGWLWGIQPEQQGSKCAVTSASPGTC